jgi:hypothetical protein
MSKKTIVPFLALFFLAFVHSAEAQPAKIYLGVVLKGSYDVAIGRLGTGWGPGLTRQALRPPAHDLSDRKARRQQGLNKPIDLIFAVSSACGNARQPEIRSSSLSG